MPGGSGGLYSLSFSPFPGSSCPGYRGDYRPRYRQLVPELVRETSKKFSSFQEETLSIIPQVVEQAAASILDLAGRSSSQSFERIEVQKVGGTSYCSSLLRLFSNKILACSVFAAIFCCTAVINFVVNENIFLESRYHVPRPTGMLLGFGDPFWSRISAGRSRSIKLSNPISD